LSRLDLIVGPNGAGKSTFVEFVLAEARPGVVFVNADVIAAERWPDNPLPHAYEAARAAQDVRAALIAAKESFIAETVGSHESKVDLVRQAKAAGYFVHLTVVAVPEEYSVARVHERVAAGGHDVPTEKIRARWRRLWVHVAAMIELADSAEVFDNTGPGPVTIATFVAGVPVGDPRWPEWIPGPLRQRWPTTRP
jgi:predicted ABC-type ATPase